MHAIINKKFYLGPKFGTLINKKWITISELLHVFCFRADTSSSVIGWDPGGLRYAELIVLLGCICRIWEQRGSRCVHVFTRFYDVHFCRTHANVTSDVHFFCSQCANYIFWCKLDYNVLKYHLHSQFGELWLHPHLSLLRLCLPNSDNTNDKASN
jgi:hypothetical protein